MGQGDTLLGWINDFWASADSGIAAAAVLRRVKIAAIGADGRYDGAPWESPALSIPGGGGTSTAPFQIARVVTLDTPAFPRNSGRMYLPVPSSTPATDGRYAQAQALAVATKTASFLSGVNSLDGAHRVVVPTIKGDLLTVNKVRCGRVPDTQRRRRNNLLEEYSSMPVTPE
jgi:hypothetical protein